MNEQADSNSNSGMQELQLHLLPDSIPESNVLQREKNPNKPKGLNKNQGKRKLQLIALERPVYM